MEEVEKYCKATAYLCGFTLINNVEHPLYNQVFAQEKLRCRANIQKQYYSDLVKRYLVPLLCPTCGTPDNLESNPPNLDGYKTHTMCKGCVPKLDLKECNGGIQGRQQ